jgi:hypothetical protein
VVVLKSRPGIGAVGVALALFASASLAAGASPAEASTLTPLDQALARAFPGARIEPLSLALSATDVKAVEQRAHARCEARLVTAYVAWHGDTLAGAAYTDRRVVRTREALLMTTIAPDTSVARIDVLAFFEPPDYRPSERWLARLNGAGASAALTPGRDVPPLAGASLTSRAVTESARLALAWHALLLMPELAKRAAHQAAPEAPKAPTSARKAP